MLLLSKILSNKEPLSWKVASFGVLGEKIGTNRKYIKSNYSDKELRISKTVLNKVSLGRKVAIFKVKNIETIYFFKTKSAFQYLM